MNISNDYYQTGDVLYFKIDKKPTGFKKIVGNLIHKGQDHEHTIQGSFELLVNKEGQMIIDVKRKSVLKHQEHKDVAIPKGLYLKRIVLEKDHFLEEVREVID